MKLLALNIRQGGGTRIDSICSYLIAQDCDALVISEFRRNNPGPNLEEVPQLDVRVLKRNGLFDLSALNGSIKWTNLGLSDWTRN